MKNWWDNKFTLAAAELLQKVQLPARCPYIWIQCKQTLYLSVSHQVRMMFRSTVLCCTQRSMHTAAALPQFTRALVYNIFRTEHEDVFWKVVLEITLHAQGGEFYFEISAQKLPLCCSVSYGIKIRLKKKKNDTRTESVSMFVTWCTCSDVRNVL